MEYLFIHIHIPKTAGSSFNQVLKNNFKNTYEEFTGRFIPLYPKFTSSQWERFIDKNPGIVAASSHNFSLDIPFGYKEKKIIAIAFLRDPIDRFFSYYFHMRNRFGVDRIEKKMDLNEYVRYKTDNGNKTLRSQLYYFQGGKERKLLLNRKVRYNLSDIKKYVNDGDLILFNTDRFEESLKYLNMRFPNHFNDINPLKKNVSHKDQKITDDLIEKVSSCVDPVDRLLLDLTI